MNVLIVTRRRIILDQRRTVEEFSAPSYRAEYS